ncbi:MAG: secretin N-terminal domain-containing protein [Candidatus Saccharicenans sp.]|nr:secretin N-terminal domain-containing protein [Candidatus Saccharicenans sp.]
MKNEAKRIRLLLIFFAVVLLYLTPAVIAAISGNDILQARGNIKKEVIKLKYVEAENMKKLLAPFWGPQTRISVDSQSRVLVVSDNPDNLARILEAIRKIDTKPKDLIFTIQLIIASESEGPVAPELKNDPLIKELQKLLRFKAYQLLDATMVRALDGRKSSITFGPNNQFTLSLDPEVSEDGNQGNIRVRVFFGQVRAESMRKVENTTQRDWVSITPVILIYTHLSLRSGDRAVVGISRLKEEGQTEENNKGIIVIITGKITG